jgi:hypothetical protein
MNPTLINPTTNIIATPNANVTPEQTTEARAQGFTGTLTKESLAPATAMTVTEPKPANAITNLGGVIEGITTNFAEQQKAQA